MEYDLDSYDEDTRYYFTQI